MENVFFATPDYTGEKFTNTSATHICNLAKESIQNWKSFIDNLKFYNTQVSLIGTGIKEDLEVNGVSDIDLELIESCLDKIAKANSLIAWFREAIKAKNEALAEVDDINIAEYCEKFNLEYPKDPVMEKALTEDEYYQSLPIKERNEYYSLEAQASVIGKAIHPDGPFSKARKDLQKKLNNPNKVNENGRDTIIYSYIPTVRFDKVDKVFFELQQKHRALQAKLNGYKHNCELAVEESKTKVSNKFINEVDSYHEQRRLLWEQMKNWKDTESARLRDLKIVLPNALKPIYEEISKLGK